MSYTYIPIYPIYISSPQVPTAGNPVPWTTFPHPHVLQCAGPSYTSYDLCGARIKGRVTKIAM